MTLAVVVGVGRRAVAGVLLERFALGNPGLAAVGGVRNRDRLVGVLRPVVEVAGERAVGVAHHVGEVVGRERQHAAGRLGERRAFLVFALFGGAVARERAGCARNAARVGDQLRHFFAVFDHFLFAWVDREVGLANAAEHRFRAAEGEGWQQVGARVLAPLRGIALGAVPRAAGDRVEDRAFRRVGGPTGRGQRGQDEHQGEGAAPAEHEQGTSKSVEAAHGISSIGNLTPELLPQAIRRPAANHGMFTRSGRRSPDLHENRARKTTRSKMSIPVGSVRRMVRAG